MQIICEPSDFYKSIWGEQQERQTAYRPCAFCLREPVEGGWLFYHLVTKELIFLEGDPENQPEETRRTLLKKWFLVPEDFDEYTWFDQIRGLLLLIRRPGDRHRYTIMTTTDCNARCFYCFEAGCSRVSMSEQTAKDAAAYILRHSAGKKVCLCWYGGEPLMNVAVIDLISEALNGKLSYEAMMISNGYLFDDEIIRRAKELWRVKKVQITLDGTERVYNRAKAYVDCEGSAYRRVTDNIGKLLAAGICVMVRLNLDSYNAEDLLTLCDELAARFGDTENLRVYTDLLYETNQYAPADALEKRKADFERLNEKLLKTGLSKPPALERGIRLGRCIADDDGSFVITPVGALGKCDHYSDKETYGSIYSEEQDQAVLDSWKERPEKIPACASCTLYPVCNRLKKCHAEKECNEFLRLRMELPRRRAMVGAYLSWRNAK